MKQGKLRAVAAVAAALWLSACGSEGRQVEIAALEQAAADMVAAAEAYAALPQDSIDAVRIWATTQLRDFELLAADTAVVLTRPEGAIVSDVSRVRRLLKDNPERVQQLRRTQEQAAGQIQALTTSPNPSAIFVPPGVDVAYDGGALARTVWDWAALNADQFLVINGADDTWSATGLTREHLADRDALVFLMEGQHHGSARIKNLGAKDQRAVVKALERWLEAPVTGWLQAH